MCRAYKCEALLGFHRVHAAALGTNEAQNTKSYHATGKNLNRDQNHVKGFLLGGTNSYAYSISESMILGSPQFREATIRRAQKASMMSSW